MMSLYPTFEELKVDQLVQEQSNVVGESYASLASFLGLDLTSFCYNEYGELVPRSTPSLAETSTSPSSTSQSQPSPNCQALAVPAGAESQSLVPTAKSPVDIKAGLRRVVLCKNGEGKVGVQLISVDNGIFVSFVRKDSPAALGGLRFGDQIVSICGQLMAGKSGEKAMKVLRKAPLNNIEVVVRDRPFERTVVVNKSSTGSIGMSLDDGEIKAIHEGSSAARNGMLTSHQIVEVNGQNVMGLKDKELKDLLHKDREPVTLTIIPTVIYKHLVKRLGNHQIRREMDRSQPSA